MKRRQSDIYTWTLSDKLCGLAIIGLLLLTAWIEAHPHWVPF